MKPVYPPAYSWLVMVRFHGGEWHCAYVTHSWEKTVDRYKMLLATDPDCKARIVCETRAYEVVAMCAHCHTQIEDRSQPDMSGTRPPRWVHHLGGGSLCHPARPDSPRATPVPESLHV